MLLLISIHLLILSSIHGELLIKPNVGSLTRDQQKSFVALCSGVSSSRALSWRSPQNQEIPSNENDRVTIERQALGIRLRIRNLTLDDQGTWQCIGVDSNGQTIEKTFNMNIRVPITFYGDSIQYAELNQSTLIHCRVQSNPLPEVIWFKGVEKVRITDDDNYQLTDDGLRIKNVDMSMNDTFWCRADVLETGESRDFSISVIVSKSVTDINVTCIEPCAIEKKTATLTCQASALPAPTYLWYFGSEDKLRQIKDTPVSASEVPKFVVRGNQLTINYVDESDSGKYSCHAFNEFDRNGQRADYNLNVIVPPRLSKIAPVEIHYDHEKTQRVTFQCRIERGSTDGLVFEWRYADKTPIISTSEIFVEKISNHTNEQILQLRFDPVRREHFGNYTCFAKNLADEASSSARLFVQFAPVYVGDNVKIVSTIPNIRTTMRCLFESYPTPQIQWIKMSRTVQDPEGRILAVGIDQGVNDITTKQIDHNLYESILSYSPNERDFGLTFECRALNPRLGRHAFVLQRAQPPHKVNVTDIKPFSTGVELLVENSNNSDLPIFQYIVKYDLHNVEHNQWQSIVFPADSSNEQQKVRIQNLSPSSDYQLTIAAESKAGVGQSLAPILFRTLDRQRPDFSIDQRENETCFDDQTCSISWTIQSDGGASIVRIQISYGLAKDEQSFDVAGSFSTPINLDASTTEYELNELKPSMNYVVLVQIFNEAGVAEQRVRIRTKSVPKDNFRRKNLLINDERTNQPIRWITVTLVLVALFATFLFAAAYLFIRSRRAHEKQTSVNGDHQTTPMMDNDEQCEKNNGAHSVSVKLVDAV